MINIFVDDITMCFESIPTPRRDTLYEAIKSHVFQLEVSNMKHTKFPKFEQLLCIKLMTKESLL